MSTTNLSLSITSITSEILALDALRVVTSCDPTLEPLTSDHLPALRRAVRGSFARLLLSLSAAVEESNIADADDDTELLTLSINVPDGVHPPTLRKLIEQTIVNLTLSTMPNRVDGSRAKTESSLAEALLDKISSMISTPLPTHLTLCGYR